MIQFMGETNRGVAQLVAYVLWEHGVAGSNPVTSTSRSEHLLLASNSPRHYVPAELAEQVSFTPPQLAADSALVATLLRNLQHRLFSLPHNCLRNLQTMGVSLAHKLTTN